MKNYNIMITGHGGELVYGKMTGTQYDYWKDRTDEMEDHLTDPVPVRYEGSRDWYLFSPSSQLTPVPRRPPLQGKLTKSHHLIVL